MRRSSLISYSAAVLVALGSVNTFSGQTFAATTGSDPVIEAPGAHSPHIGVPAHHRRAEEKLLWGRVRDGVYTVDGMTAKVQLNYDIKGVAFVYLFVPGVGTAVISATADPDQIATPATFKNEELSFQVGEHHFNLTGIALASDRGSAPEHLYVRLDRSAWHLNRQPMIGFGNVSQMPYVWPGALPPATASQPDEPRVGPPVPASLLPSRQAVVPSSAAAAEEPAALGSATLR